MQKEIPVLYKRKEECCGCTACYAICPKEAISMVEDEEGFEYPQIDESKCVRCYQCLKVCPFKNIGDRPQCGQLKQSDSMTNFEIMV